MAVHRAAGAVRDRRIRLGRGVAAATTAGSSLSRHPGVPRRPAAASASAATETTAALVHLRRPSRLSTLTLADTQPFDDPAGRFAFSHNGDLRDYQVAARARYRAEGRIHGRADTEVGARWLEDAWRRRRAGGRPPGRAARPVRRPGQPRGPRRPTATPFHYAGNTENPVFTFRLGRIGIASTGIYSLDRSLFRFVAPGATERRLVRLARSVTLDRHGTAVPARRRIAAEAAADGTPMSSRDQPALDDRSTATDARPCPIGAPRPDLAVLARPDGHRRRGRAVRPEPAELRRLRPTARGRPRPVPASSIPVGAIIAIIVQPTVGSISDYTVSRWGRRKPYIVVGSLLDIVFLAGIATANTVLILGAFVALLAFSTNIARGPFQGYVPDLIPERQVGIASALVGLMQILGNVTGLRCS